PRAVRSRKISGHTALRASQIRAPRRSPDARASRFPSTHQVQKSDAWTSISRRRLGPEAEIDVNANNQSEDNSRTDDLRRTPTRSCLRALLFRDRGVRQTAKLLFRLRRREIRHDDYQHDADHEKDARSIVSVEG